jgi:hypothetical protein
MVQQAAALAGTAIVPAATGSPSIPAP